MNDLTLGMIVGTFLGGMAMLVVIITSNYNNGTEYRADAIERGYALYCPTTGVFAWEGECDV